MKSLRDGKLSLEESYARVKDGAVWLVGADIAEYPQATIWNHAPKRPRKLLMKQAEVRKFAALAHEKGLTLIPLKVYFTSRGVAKILLGLCKRQKAARQAGYDEEGGREAGYCEGDEEPGLNDGFKVQGSRFKVVSLVS